MASDVDILSAHSPRLTVGLPNIVTISAGYRVYRVGTRVLWGVHVGWFCLLAGRGWYRFFLLLY